MYINDIGFTRHSKRKDTVLCMLFELETESNMGVFFVIHWANLATVLCVEELRQPELFWVSSFFSNRSFKDI